MNRLGPAAVRRAAVAGAAALALAALAAAPATAAPGDGVVVAAPVGNQVGYAPALVVVGRGGEATLVNADPTQPHDVVALDLGPDGRPLFRSPRAAFGEAAAVAGVAALAPGEYRFTCSIHGTMNGTLTVRDA